MKFDKKSIGKYALFGLAGAGLGYAYYFYIGCAGGSCPISSNPVVSTIYGSVLGVLLAFPGKKEKDENK